MKPFNELSWRRGLAEFGVIVISILIALAADDWYAGIQQRTQEVAWVTGIRDDLFSDQATLRRELSVVDESTKVIRELIESIDNQSAPISDSLGYLRKIKRANITFYFRPTATTYSELTGGRNLSAISSRTLTRAVIEYHQAALLTDDINDYIRQVRWFDYSEVLSELIDPAVFADMTEDYIRQSGEWPSDGTVSPLESTYESVDIGRLRSDGSFRAALARGLDATVVQRGDLYRMLQACETVLALAEAQLGELED